jgi:peptidyl-tRNA hydrolase, PTH1 family
VPGEAWLVVGLGNPGPEYERTRHNAGFRVVDILAGRLGARLKTSRQRAVAGDGRDAGVRIVLAKPTTFMNESGDAVGRLARYHKIPVERIVVVHDEIDLPVGTLRVKRGGGTAGHKGLDSVVASLGSADFARVRVGAGRPSRPKGAADHVLRPLPKREEELFGVTLEEAADAVMTVIHEGVAEAQNRFNAARA